MPDWYPQNIDARAAWHQNFVDKLPAFALKYSISAADQTQATDDNDWMQWVVTTRHGVSTFSQQVTQYFNAIAGNDPAAQQPVPLGFGLTAAPGEPPTGIENRTRQWAAQIKGTTDYAVADGEALGIVAPATPPVPVGAPEILGVKTLSNFELQVSFRKRGMDALKIQFRYKGGNWQEAGFLVTSPGTIAIAPQVANTGEQVEVRAIYIQNNNEVGSFSAAIPAFIAA